PDSTAWLALGIASASTSPSSLPVACSRPLAHNTTGFPAGRWRASSSATARTCWAGATIMTASCAAMRARSKVASMPASSATPGRTAELVWLALSSAPTSGSRAHKHTSRPARRSVCARAVPHAPPPITPRREKVMMRPSQEGPRLPSKHGLGADAQCLDAGTAEQHGADAVVLGCGLPHREAVLDALGWAHQCRLLDECVGHCGGGLLPASRKEGILDLDGRGLKAQAFDEVVVEILRPCAHATNVERHFRLERIAAGRNILAHGDADKG